MRFLPEKIPFLTRHSLAVPAVCFALMACFVLAGVTHAEDFPYTAVINDDSVYIYSGPGSTYYTTDVFQRGDSVEVYKHAPGGWCAIRPPAGSFSWVARQYVQPLGDGLAKITSDDVASRVGSKLVPAERTQIMVTLRTGKIVELQEDLSAQGQWCKISPPSGEFRWVQEKYLSAPAARQVESGIPGVNAGTAAGAGGNGDGKGPQVGTAGAAGTGQHTQNFMRHLNFLDADLSRIMANYDAAQWDTPGLLMRANALMNRAETDIQKDQVAQVRDKILQADTVRRKKRELLRMESDAQADRPMLAGTSPPGGAIIVPPRTITPFPDVRTEEISQTVEPPMAAPYSNMPGRYDYEGILQPTQPRELKDLSMPRYALVDEQGNVRCYVTPSPGKDLASFVGMRVGVAGTRTYLTDHRAYNLVAREIRDLTSTARR